MYLWCENCHKETRSLSGKYDIRICHECGCEVRHQGLPPSEEQWTSMAATGVSTLDDEDGGFSIGLAQLESQGVADEQWLETSRYLPASFYDQQSELAKDVVDLDESWSQDDLLNKIQKLEDSIRPRGSETGSKRQWRVDMGHVVTQHDLQRTRPADPWADAPAQPLLEKKTLPIARKLGEVKEIRIDTPETLVEVAEDRKGARVQLTSLGLVSTWIVQLLIGISWAPQMSPSLWGTWLLTQATGTICLGYVLYNLFLNPANETGGQRLKSGHLAGTRKTQMDLAK